MAPCTLCPRCCGVDRRNGERGFCRAGDAVQIYRYGAHRGEEPPLSGARGSGTIFFSRCTLRCLYCQNYPWSQEGRGRGHAPEEFAHVLRALHAAGCHNWNLVSPTPWLPHVRRALATVRAEGIDVPVVWNTSGYERTETLAAYADCADVYLADLRYAQPESARTGSGAADYVARARAALRWMWQRTGPLATDDAGTARRGTICRLLVLPGRAEEAVANLRWLAATVGPAIPVSIMAQYTPAYRAPTRPGWDRRVTRAEYDAVCAAVEELGFATGWVQDFGGATDTELLGYEMKESS